MDLIQAIQQLREDLKLWASNNLNFLNDKVEINKQSIKNIPIFSGDYNDLTNAPNIYEDEANFISFLACIQSEDIFFQYSGYLSVLYYLDNDFYAAVGDDKYWEQPWILPQVHEDNIFLKQEDWTRIEEEAVLDTETVDEISDTFTDTVLKANGVEDGMISYSRVVKLLLWYYREERVQ